MFNWSPCIPLETLPIEDRVPGPLFNHDMYPDPDRPFRTINDVTPSPLGKETNLHNSGRESKL